MCVSVMHRIRQPFLAEACSNTSLPGICVLVEYICSRTHIPGREVLEQASARKGCLILCITDTHIQNLYTEWEYLKEASQCGEFVLFCIDQAGKDKYVEEALSSLGTVYYLNALEDLIGLVVETAEKAYSRNTGIQAP